MPTLPDFWLDPKALTGRALAPVGLLFANVARLRRTAYRRGWRRSIRLPVPVVVVGNIFVGGTGKTPMVDWVARHLASLGRRPGILVRGYGGRSEHWPQLVVADSDPAQVGDEAVLLAQRTALPVAAGPDRIAGARLLLEQGCDVLVSDDGLQHYRLARDLELVLLDAERGLGNGRCLPAGPLREPAERLATVDLVLANGGATALTADSFTLVPGELISVDGQRRLPVGELTQVHAVAGIGNPERFFVSLRQQGLQVIAHPFPDHHPYAAADLEFGDDRPVVMTEKDAVKARAFAKTNWWYQPVTAAPAPRTAERLEQLLAHCLRKPRP
jgi:tetraacyldisaccharide 4'-kinase